ncbi:MAG: class I SAM-dependent methyltransferase [Nanoarchaeota archaeon]
MKNLEWWENEGGFFGEKYMEGDDSLEGFIPNKKQLLSERTKREVNGIITLSAIREGAKILDIPCGYGRHSIELSKKGFSVVGIDINEKHLIKAKKESKGLSIEFIKKDMRDIGKENYNKFDLVTNMFYSFGFFEKEKENDKAMGEFYNALKNKGKFILHTDVSPEILEGKNYRLREKRTLANGKELVIEEKYNKQNNRMEGSWTILSKNNENKLTPYSVRIYSKTEFEALAKKVGFKNVKFYGSFKGDVFDNNSLELIMVAEK